MPRKGPNVHVVPSATKPGKFVAKEAGNPKPITRPATQAATIAKAIPVAKANQSEVVIHGRNAKIRDRDSYGVDPSRRAIRSTEAPSSDHKRPARAGAGSIALLTRFCLVVLGVGWTVV